MERSEYTRLMWQQLPPAIREAQSLENTKDQWWHDTRHDGGWRLTFAGYVDLSDLLHQASWDFDFEKQSLPAYYFLKLNYNLKSPYYIVSNRKHTRLVVFDSRAAVMINLYGQVDRWISNL